MVHHHDQATWEVDERTNWGEVVVEAEYKVLLSFLEEVVEPLVENGLFLEAALVGLKFVLEQEEPEDLNKPCFYQGAEEVLKLMVVRVWIVQMVEGR